MFIHAFLVLKDVMIPLGVLGVAAVESGLLESRIHHLLSLSAVALSSYIKS